MTRRLQRVRDDDADMGMKLTCFVLGASVGALVALLFAPKAGRELREDIADVTRKGVDRARETGAQIGARAGEVYDAASARAGEIAQSARDVAARRGEQVTAAIEAGKQAYLDEKRRTESAVMLEPAAGE
jgi:gas vesicle protein